MFELRCKDVGFDCPGVLRSASRDELLQQAAAHAAQAHAVAVTPALAQAVMAAIREDAGDGSHPPQGESRQQT